MNDRIGSHAWKSIAFGAIMAIVGFFIGWSTFTFPPVWREWLRIFLICAVTFFLVNVLFDCLKLLFDRLRGKGKKD